MYINHKRIREGNVIKEGRVYYLLLEAIPNTFISYIPDCDNEVDGTDEHGNYFDDNKCKVFAYETWRAAEFPNLIYKEIRLHIQLPKWGTLIKPHNIALYNKISINEKAHEEWAKIIE